MSCHQVSEITSIIFMATALSMDSFSISLGMGMQSLRLKRIALIGLSFGFFHILLPFIGVAIGQVLSVKIGHFTTLVSGLLLVGIGLQMILNVFTDHQRRLIIQPYGFGLFVLSLSVSLDSFPVGLSLGLSGLSTIIVLALFGIICTLLTWIGFFLGRKVRGYLGVYSELLGGSILLAFGLKFIFGT